MFKHAHSEVASDLFQKSVPSYSRPDSQSEGGREGEEEIFREGGDAESRAVGDGERGYVDGKIGSEGDDDSVVEEYELALFGESGRSP